MIFIVEVCLVVMITSLNKEIIRTGHVFNKTWAIREVCLAHFFDYNQHHRILRSGCCVPCQSLFHVEKFTCVVLIRPLSHWRGHGSHQETVTEVSILLLTASKLNFLGTEDKSVLTWLSLKAICLSLLVSICWCQKETKRRVCNTSILFQSGSTQSS